MGASCMADALPEQHVPPASCTACTACHAQVDNYQGEEADVVIASLVRSNKDRSVGFLREPERINVLLSRARHGVREVIHAGPCDGRPWVAMGWE